MRKIKQNKEFKVKRRGEKKRNRIDNDYNET